MSGSDTTVKMGRTSVAQVWPDGADSDAVTAILKKYGYTPDVDPTPAKWT